MNRTNTASPRPRLKRVAAVATLLGVAAIAAPALGDPVADLARRLAGLRGEVEKLSAELSRKDTDLRDQLRGLARQKAELKLDLQKEQARLQKTQLAISQKKTLIESEKQGDHALRPVFENALVSLRAYVKGGLPFRTAERIAEIDKIEEQYKAGLLTPPRALSRLWTFMEDEFRLTRETGMYRQAIKLDGKEELSDVVRVGTVMLFFKTSDDVVGYATRGGSGWEYRKLEEPADKRLVVTLFDSLKKQIRVGLFELPNALAAERK
ncbi:MAG TPA: DUF3450 family protein [Polyangiaceae bacterium]